MIRKAALAGVAVFCLAFTALASAYPESHFTPRINLHRPAAPPTTAECLAELQIACYRPAQLQTAYNMKALYAQGDEGQGRTIVIVDSFGSPTIERDLKRFDAAFRLPAPPSFQVIQPAGAVKPYEPGNEEMSGWAGETTLDVEWAHSMAPQANILLVETPEEETEGVQGFPDIVAAENYVIAHHMGDVISQSFSATEQSFPSPASIMSLRSAYENAAAHRVTVLDAAGDEGVAGENVALEWFPFRTVEWPASDPLVTGIGGTQLHLNEEGQRTAPDNAWDELLGNVVVSSAGGVSHVFEKPGYQQLVQTHSGAKRAVPDISMSAAVNGGVLTYSSYAEGEIKGPRWEVSGGTSEATPVFSGVVAIADQIAGHPLGQINERMYQLAAGGLPGIVDVTSGNNSFVEFGPHGEVVLAIKGYEAGKGYDLVTGLGTVNAFAFAHELAGR
jgi:subtilase family serine protease